jgi:hypothetical protein
VQATSKREIAKKGDQEKGESLSSVSQSFPWILELRTPVAGEEWSVLKRVLSTQQEAALWKKGEDDW